MSQKPKSPANPTALRRRAEAQLNNRTPRPQTDADPQRVQHDLEVHPVGLKLQDPELQPTQARLEEALTRNTEFYDFAPVGFLSLQPDGIITHANRTAADLLGVPVSRLLQRRFGVFVPTTERVAFAALLARTFESERPLTAELSLGFAGHSPRIFLVQACRSANGLETRLVLTDISERKRAEAILQARLRLSEFAPGHSLDTLITRALDEAELLTGSTVGFFHFVEADQKTLLLQAWSTNTLRRLCTAEGKGRHYPADQAGVWAEALRERRPVIHNDYASLPQRKGLPAGHTPMVRELVVPVLRNERVVALLGVGNKPIEYEPHEIESLSQLASLAWDIVLAKQAEAQLREQRTLLENVVEGTHAGTWRWNVQTGQAEVNERWARMVGYTVAELAPVTIQTWLELVHPGDLKNSDVARDAHFNRIADYYECEFRMKHKDGSWVWMEDRGKVVEWTPDGKPLFMAGTHVEITARKLAEAALAERDDRMKFLLRNTPAVIYSLNPADGFATTFISENVEDVLGYSTTEFVKNPAFWSAHVYPDDLAGAQADLQKLPAAGKLVREYRFGHADGSYRWMHDEMHLIRNDQGQATMIVGFWLDVTQRHEANTALQLDAAMMRNMADGVHLTRSSDGVIIQVNSQFEQMFGYGPGEIAGRHVSSLNATTDKDPIQMAGQIVAAVQQCGKWQGEILNLKKDGTPFWCFASVSIFTHPALGELWVSAHQDITVRKQAEAQLRASEECFRDLFAKHAAVKLIIDPKTGAIRDANEAAASFYGWPVAQLQQMHIQDINQLPAAKVDQALANVTGRQQRRFEFRHRLADGAIRDVEVFSSPIETAGEVVLYSIIQDITERKEAETALRASEVRYRGLFESAKDGLLILDAETGMVLDVNPFLIELLGFSHEAFLGKKVWELGFFKETLANQNNFAELQQKEYLRYEDLALETHDGRRIHVEFISSVYRVNHQKVIQCSIRDITARKQLQAAHTRLATAVEQAGESIMITDAERTIVYVNPAFEKVSGYTRAEVLGQNARLLKSGKQEAQFYRHLWEVLERGETWNGHFTNRHKDGSYYEEEATISPIRDGQGRTINYVAVKHDVTRELQLEAQYRQAQKLEAIGQLAGGIAHDFNNILAAILGNAQLAVADTDPKHLARESLEEIAKAAVRAKDLVEQILTYSRQQPQDRRVIAFDPIITEAAKFLRATIPSGIEIASAIAAGVPPVLADATQIHQVVFNLCTNAWHALEDRPGRIGIQLQTVTLEGAAAEAIAGLRAGRFVSLTVSDTGKGMDAATLARIFDPFFTTKEVGKGTGLGLSVVRGIVESHDGAITVVSQPGQGTTFQVYFPVAVAPADSAVASAELVHPGRGEHVLFLDDEEALVRLSRRMLERLGYRVTSFTRSADALQAFRANPSQFEIVITDLNMPGASGMDVAREVLTVRPDVPVVLCSGRITPQMDEQARSAGIRHVLYKPTTVQELSATLHRLLPARRLT